MARIRRAAVCALLALGLAAGVGHVFVEAASCTPLKTGLCRACKNCRYCGHCAKGGGKCSVCDR